MFSQAGILRNRMISDDPALESSNKFDSCKTALEEFHLYDSSLSEEDIPGSVRSDYMLSRRMTAVILNTPECKSLTEWEISEGDSVLLAAREKAVELYEREYEPVEPSAPEPVSRKTWPHIQTQI